MGTHSHQVAPLVLRALINHTYSWYGRLVKVRGLGFGSHFLIPPLISVQGRWTVPCRLGPPQVPTCGTLRAQYLPKNTCLCICQPRTPACALNPPGSNPQRRRDGCWRTYTPASCPSRDNPRRNFICFSKALESQKLNLHCLQLDLDNTPLHWPSFLPCPTLPFPSLLLHGITSQTKYLHPSPWVGLWF